MASLFTGEKIREHLPLPDCEILLHHQFLSRHAADTLFETLIQDTPWQQDQIRIAGRILPVPRLQAWYGDEHSFYAYSGIDLSPLPWTPVLETLRQQVESSHGYRFNSALLNLYRNGQDSVSWHADNEPELGTDPVIASLSLGSSRTFMFKSREDAKRRFSCQLEHGSLLLMGQGTQIHWLHQVPKEAGVTEPRINITFRLVRQHKK